MLFLAEGKVRWQPVQPVLIVHLHLWSQEKVSLAQRQHNLFLYFRFCTHETYDKQCAEKLPASISKAH